MPSRNKVSLMGHLTADIEVFKTKKGSPGVTFCIAVNYTCKDEEGKRKNIANFFNVEVWGYLTGLCERFLKKGSLVLVDGYLQNYFKSSPEGVKRIHTKIIAEEIQFFNKSLSEEEKEETAETIEIEEKKEEDERLSDSLVF